MSISPFAGHPPEVPSVQKAGHIPGRVSMRARISKRPCCQLCSPRVVRLAEVYSICSRLRRQLSLPACYIGFGFVSRRASMISIPSSTKAFSG